METDYNSSYDGSPNVSVEEEEEEEEEEAEGQRHRLTSSLKKLYQNEEVKSKLSDAIDTIQSEDSGLPWDTSSSRCSTSLASETSATSGNNTVENSFPLDDGKMAQKRTPNTPDQAPLPPDENIGTMDKKYDFSSRPMQIKVPERELDPADPQSWSFQVQPSKIKDYLVQITQEVEAAGPEEKENALMKKGELPLKGTVRARIQQITAVLEERNKKIFRRVNQKDVPPPSEIIRKPREQSKVFSRHGISVSLRHVEREPPDKQKKKEILSYNLRHVETNISKSGYNKDEKRVRRSFPTKNVHETSEKLAAISSPPASKGRKLESKLYSPVVQTSVPEQAIIAPPNHHKKMEEEETQPLLEGTTNVMPEESSILIETKRQDMQDDLSVTMEVTGDVEASKVVSEREPAEFHPQVSAEPPSSPVEEGMPNATVTVLSEPAAQDALYLKNIAAAQPQSEQSVFPDARNQDAECAVPLLMDINDATLLLSAEETGKQNIPLDSPETAGSLSERKEYPSPAGAAKKEEPEKVDTQGYVAVFPQAEKEPVQPTQELAVGETGTIPDLAATSRTETQASQSNAYQTAEEHLGLPQLSSLMDEVQEQAKERLETDSAEQAAQAEKAVASSLEAGQADVSSSKDRAMTETALIESSEVPHSVSDTWREEMHQVSAAASQPESQHPVISETTKAPEVSKPAELALFKEEEVGSDSGAEAPSSSEQLPTVSSPLNENGERQGIMPTSLVTATPLSEQLKPVLPSAAERVEKQGHIPCSLKTASAVAETMKEQGPLPYSTEIAAVVAEPMEKQGLLPYSLEIAPVIQEATEKQVLPCSLEAAPVRSEHTEKQDPQPCSQEAAPVMAEPTKEQAPLPYSPETALVMKEPMEKPGHIPSSPETVSEMKQREKKGPPTYSPEAAPLMAEPMEKQGPLPYSPEISPVMADIPSSLQTVPVMKEPREKQGPPTYSPGTAPIKTEPMEKQSSLPYSPEASPGMADILFSPEMVPVMEEPREKQGPLTYYPDTAPIMAEPVEKQSSLPYSPETSPVMADILTSPEMVPVMEEPREKQGPLTYYSETAPIMAEPVEKQSSLPYSPERSPVMADIPSSLETVPVMKEPREKQATQTYSPETVPIMAEPVEKQGSLPSSPGTCPVMADIPSSPETLPVMKEPREKQATPTYSPKTAPIMTEPMEQGLLSNSPETAPVVSEATEKQDHLFYSPERAPLLEETLLVIQNDKVAKGEIEHLPATDGPSEEGGSLSRRPSVASDRKTGPLVSPISILPYDASAPSQEEGESSQPYVPVNRKLRPVDEEESHPTICGGLQKGQLPSLAMTLKDLDHLVKSESKQSMKGDSSEPSQLAETIAQFPDDEAEEKIIHPDKLITEPLNIDRSHPACVLEEQERAQMAVEETTQQLLHTCLSMEADILQPMGETEINGNLPHVPATMEDLCQPDHLMETEDHRHFPQETAALDSGSLSTTYTTDEVQKWGSTEIQSKDSTRQAVQAAMTEFEAEYQNVSLPAATSVEPVALSHPSASTEGEDLQLHRSAVTELASEQPVSSEREREDTELYSVITPVSNMECLVVRPETQERKDFSCDAFNEASKPPPLISSLAANQIRDRGILTESLLSSSPIADESDSISSDVNSKDDRQESQFPITPKMEEGWSFASFLVGEARAEPPYSILAPETVQEPLRSTPVEVVSKYVSDMAPPSTLVSASHLSNQITSSYAASEGQKEEQTPLLLNEESKPMKEIRNQDSLLPLSSMVPAASQEQEILYYKKEAGDQERTTLETQSLTEQDVVQKLSIPQQELGHLILLQPRKESQRESIQPYLSTAVQESSQPTDTTGTEEHQDSLPETELVKSGVAELSESTCEEKVEEIQPVWFDAAHLEHKPSALSAEERGQLSHTPDAAPLHLGHLDSSYSTETPVFSPESQNQISEQKSSVSPLLNKKMEEQGVNSHPSEVFVTSSLSQPTCALEDIPEEDEKPKPQPPEEEEEGMVSLAAFLLSEANTICMSSLLTSKKENPDPQTSFVEAGLSAEKLGSAFADLSDIGKTTEEKVEASTPSFEAEQFTSKPDTTLRCSVEDRVNSISDIPALPKFIQNELSSTITSEPIKETHLHNLHSSVSSIASETMADKGIIGAEDFAKTEEEKCFSHVEETLKEPETYFKIDEKRRDHETVKESILAPELSRAKETVDISESYEAESIDAPPFISSTGTEEDANGVESLEYLVTASSQKAKQVKDASVAIDNEPPVCKLRGDTSEGLEAENREYKEKESKIYSGENIVQQSAEINLDVSVNLENQGDNILKPTSTDYVEKFILINDTSITQAGKEKSVEETQNSSEIKNEKLEKIPSSAARSENIMAFSLLERDLGDAFQGVVKGKNVTITHEVSDKDKIIATVTGDDRKTEGELNVADAGVPSTEEDELSQSFLTSLPATAVTSDGLEVAPTLAFLYNDFDKEATGESKEGGFTCPSDLETLNSDLPTHSGDHVPDKRIGILAEKDTPEECSLEETQDKQPNLSNLEDTQNEPEDQFINEQALRQSACETNEEEYEFNHLITKTHGQTEILSPSKLGDLRDTVTERPAEIVSDITVETCKPTHAIPFGGGLFRSGASSDDNSQQREESVAEEPGHISPEETSDEESSPILDYAASVYPNEGSAQDEPRGAPSTVGQNQQPEEMDAHDVDTDVIRKPTEESTWCLESYQEVSTQRQSEGQQEDKIVSTLKPFSQDVQPLDHEYLPCWGAEELTPDKRVKEAIGGDLMEHRPETADQLELEANYDRPFGELDYSLLSHEFDTHPLYSIKEEEYSDIDEDLAELMDYDVVTQNDVFQAETSSEAACEELLFDDRKSLDRVSDSYEFVNEREASLYAEEEVFELMESDKLPRNVPESDILQKETVEAHLEAYCYQCKCPISAQDRLFGDHKGHDVTDLDTAVKVLKSQLDGFQDILQERSIKIEEFVSEIEALFNSLEENCKEKEQLLEEQNESIVKMVIDHHERKAQSFEGIKNTKMEYLYEQMVIFQEYIDTAKETLETIIKEAEEMDDFVFLRSSEEINKRLISAAENILTLEKMPDAFSQFEHYAGGSANGGQTFKHMPVPQTPKLQPQEPNSATSTSIAVYWTVDEDAIIDFFQVYCMEEYPGSKEQSGLVEEYRVTVKESNCILEDLEAGHSYSVWVMAVNYAGCSFPSDKSTFRTAPPTPVMKAEDCTVCWDTATIRWSTINPEATDSFTLEYCRQYSPEGEGLRSLAGIKRPEMKVHLESNVNYFFYVRAVNVFGSSEQSEAALISTKGTRFRIMKETAHPALHVSPNGTMICLPADAKLTGISPVLGELLCPRGWHYWETTVSGCEAYRVGICYSRVPQDFILGQNNTSWCFHCSNKTSFVYKVLHNGEISDVFVTEQPARLGILLDYNTGRLLFFNAERGQVLSTIRHKFTEVVHPAFMLEQPGVLSLHTGMELPEFVKQS